MISQVECRQTLQNFSSLPCFVVVFWGGGVSVAQLLPCVFFFFFFFWGGGGGVLSLFCFVWCFLVDKINVRSCVSPTATTRQTPVIVALCSSNDAVLNYDLNEI